MRKSTKRKADLPKPSDCAVGDDGFGSDDDDVVEVWEEVEFSETDSENEHGSSTDESDLEYESRLAEQISSTNKVSILSIKIVCNVTRLEDAKCRSAYLQHCRVQWFLFCCCHNTLTWL
jgi:hypothetical protein